MEINLSFVSEDIEQLAQYIEQNPQNWRQDSFDLIHKKEPKMEIWIASGMGFYKVDGCRLNWFEKFRLHRAIKKFRKYKVSNAIRNALKE